MPDITYYAPESAILAFKTYKFIVALLAIVIYLRKPIKKIPLALISGFLLIFYYATYRTGQDVNSVFNIALTIISGCLIVVIAIEQYGAAGLRGLLGAYELIIYINLLTIIFIPEGIYQSHNYPMYFIGYDNTFIWTYIPAICLAELFYMVNLKRTDRTRIRILLAICLYSGVQWEWLV
jgi:hypothetical protein